MPEQFSIISVSQLNKQVKSYLENEIGIVHVEGEVSNLSKPFSGHFYFTLKDANAQVRCVFFKNRHIGSIATKLSDGQQVVASGKLSLYEARGDYQLIVEQLTESGLGELYKRFEELKNKLAAEGLFLQSRKKDLPAIPQTIGVITSASGAAIRDILSTLARRFPLAQVVIYPSEVQGSTAPQQLIKALQLAHTDARCDVLILARGGGSLEDLWAFNDERLAREIAASTIPIVSGVGHETDFTIADFVADYRAETPTAAAAAATPNCIELLNMLNNAISRLHIAMKRIMHGHQLRVKHLSDKISSPKQNITVYWQTLDYLERRLLTNLTHLISQKKNQLHLYSNQLQAQNPKTLIQQTKMRLAQITAQLTQEIQIKINHLKYRLNNNLATLHAVSPLATLDRGYAIATKKHKVLYTTQQLQIGDTIEIRLAKGNLECEVTHIKPE
ncbi:exodeoxyribonuclease VII large subunit [Legionella fallonii]|uniref:Exodeoxyribonuclease 7 large subunit n=1 Tax=Legionella fallonii LLAP-10 TaxID=1212491 RepID=A0A098G4B3_9GAMM|nr:exodeoxyribonuclease VII large subunit [Legionella fallonii]CEG56320.1 Exodeoxyribonuclease 7 large subunit [Legionella fallonii LLAP-10]